MTAWATRPTRVEATHRAVTKMSQRDPSQDMASDHIGPYRVGARLAKGGMGEVYRGHDERLDRPVALKRISAANAGSARLRERFRREAKIVARLNHPSIVQVFDWLEEQGENWLVMELVDGASLREVASQGTLSMRQLVVCALGIAQGLEAAHRAGIIHRDLKLSNVMLTEEGVKILDFGIAKSLRRSNRDDMTTLTEEGVVMGSLSSMSPEQALGQRVDHRSDLFSLGSVIYELLAGRAPFKAKNASETLIRIYSWEHLPVEECNPEVPYRLCRLVDRLLEKEPANRPVDASEVVLELEEVATDLGGLSSRIFKVPAAQPGYAPDPHTEDLSPAALEATLPNGLPTLSTKVEIGARPAEDAAAEGRSGLRPAALGLAAAAVLSALALLFFGPGLFSSGPSAPQASGVAPAGAAAAADNAAAAPLAARRLAVVPFENRTGQTELDVFGLIIADWLSRGLEERVELVPLEVAARAARDPATDGAAQVPADVARGIAADFVISGAYYRSDEELILRSQIHGRSAGRVVASSEALRIPADDPIAGLAILEQALEPQVAELFDLPPAQTVPAGRAAPLDFGEYASYVEQLESSWQQTRTDAGDE